MAANTTVATSEEPKDAEFASWEFTGPKIVEECSGNCDQKQISKGWCSSCFGPWELSSERHEILDKCLGWAPGTLQLVTCYGETCDISLENGGNVHCIECFPNIALLIKERCFAPKPKLFDPKTDAPRLISKCDGYKCREMYASTGIWCVSCWGTFRNSDEYLELLENRFKNLGYSASNVTSDIDFSNDH